MNDVIWLTGRSIDDVWMITNPFFSVLLLVYRSISPICWSRSSGTTKRRGHRSKPKSVTDPVDVCSCPPPTPTPHLTLSLSLSCPDTAALLVHLSEVPDLTGGPWWQESPPRGTLPVSVLWTCSRCFTAAVSPVERTTVPAHVHQRSPGTALSSLRRPHVPPSRWCLHPNVPTAPGPWHRLVRMSADHLWATQHNWGRPGVCP